MAALVLDVACFVLIGVIAFSASQSNLAFFWVKCCHLTICFHLMEPNFSGDHSPDPVGPPEEDQVGRPAVLRSRKSHPEHALASAPTNLGKEYLFGVLACH